MLIWVLGLLTVSSGKFTNIQNAAEEVLFTQPLGPTAQLVIERDSSLHQKDFLEFFAVYQFEASSAVPANADPNAVAAADFGALDLSARRLLAEGVYSFEVSLATGVWSKEWKVPPVDLPPAGIYAQATIADQQADAGVWKHILSSAGGLLCGGFGLLEMDEKAEGREHLLPSENVPGTKFYSASDPREHACTENLTPTMKLLPCGRMAGLTTVIDPHQFARSPYRFLRLKGRRSLQTDGSLEVAMTVQVAVVLRSENVPKEAVASIDFAKMFDISEETLPCPGVESFIEVRTAGAGPALQGGGHWQSDEDGGVSRVKVFPRDSDAGEAPETNILHLPLEASMDSQLLRQTPSKLDDVQITRTLLRHAGVPERIHGVWRVHVTVPEQTHMGRRVIFVDRIPHYLEPQWHTLCVHVGESRSFRVKSVNDIPGPPEPFPVTCGEPFDVFEIKHEFAGLDAVKKLRMQFSPGGNGRPVDFQFDVLVPSATELVIEFQVRKQFLHSSFWKEVSDKGEELGYGTAFYGPLATYRLEDRGAGSLLGWPQCPFARVVTANPNIALLALPDFSFTFNGIAFGATVLLLAFTSTARVVAKRPTKESRSPAKQVLSLLRLLVRRIKKRKPT